MFVMFEGVKVLFLLVFLPPDFAGERLSSIGKIRDPNPALAFFKIEFDASSLFVVNLFDHLDHPFV